MSEKSEERSDKGLRPCRLPKSSVDHLASPELEFEIKIRGGTPKATVAEKRRQLRKLLDREIAGTIVVSREVISVSEDEVTRVKSTLDTLKVKVEGFSDSCGSPKYSRLVARLQHLLNYVSYWDDTDNDNLRESKQTIYTELSRLSTMLAANAVNSQESSDDEDDNGEEKAEMPQLTGDSGQYIEEELGDIGTRLETANPVPTSTRPISRDTASAPDANAAVHFRPSQVESHRRRSFPPTPMASARPLKVHQWGLRFSGEPGSLSVHSFLEKLELKLRVHQVTWDVMLHHVSELLEGVAFTWYLGRMEQFISWEEFEYQLVEAFGIPSYQAHLFRQIATTTQGPNESVTAYLAKMRIMFRRCPEPLSTEAQVNLVISGALPKYQDLLILPPLSTLDDVEAMLKRLEISRSYNTQFYGTYEPELSGTSFQRSQTSFSRNNRHNNWSRRSRYYNQHHVPQPNNQFRALPAPPQPVAAIEPQAGPSHEYNEPPVIMNRTSPIHCYRCGKPGETTRTCSCSQPKRQEERRKGKGGARS